MVSNIAFLVLVLAVGVQRLWEVRKSARNEAKLRALGAREHAPEQMRVMRLVHATWIASMLIEVFVLSRPWDLRLAAPALLLFLCGQTLRLMAMHALGDRWTVKVITLPGAPPVAHGIFRALRHPNYLGVVLEIFALPLVHGAWITSVVFTIANGLLLRARVSREEEALNADNDYDAAFGDRPRFVPGMRA